MFWFVLSFSNAATPDEAAIQALSTTYHQAMGEADRKKMASTMFGDEVQFIGTWASWTHEPTLILPWNQWFDPIESYPGAEEVAEDYDIEVSGDIASARFSYTYSFQGVKRISGREFWNLVRTEQGWKITAVNWNMVPIGEREKPATLDASQLGALAGAYDAGGEKILVAVEGDHLIVSMPWDEDKMPYLPRDERTFFRPARPDVLLVWDMKKRTVSYSYKGEVQRMGKRR